ncbi:olfactory receptor 14A2-like [Nannospalax galili]|uniref:olfactory receptor 14A2-like n=1 Tax=Nannospalax galili TaxID=1026970 RepID=UPI0004ED2660|nr:olfactory receptor 14A2-like [Nannospalax galili]
MSSSHVFSFLCLTVVEQRDDMTNHTVNAGFFLMEFPGSKQLQVLQGFLFLLIYLVSLRGNFLIIMLVTVDQCLHTPMYFFLKNLSFSNVCFISVTVPKLFLSSLSHRSTISFPGCVCQVLFVVSFVATEISILTTISYDRYVAICHPLQYDAIMNRAVCVQMVVASWFFGNLFGALYSYGTFSLSFCGSRKVPQFFCDVPSLLKISCSKMHIVVDISVLTGAGYGCFCLVCIVCSYVYIFYMVLRMPLSQGRSKAFSTCTPYLIVITTFLVTTFTAYLKPFPDSPRIWDFLLSVLYFAMPPSLNPVTYSLRNKEIKAALWNFYGK